MSVRMLRPDAKGRITLGPLAKGVSGFSVTQTSNRTIVLEPYSEIPTREKWLFDNKQALQKLNQGLKEMANGQLIDKGSFAKFIDDNEE